MDSGRSESLERREVWDNTALCRWEKRGPYKIAAPFQNCVLFGVLSIVALFNGYDEGDQHYGGNRSRSKNQQIERGPICVPDHVRKLTAWEDVAADALAARSAGKNLCPQSLPAQKGE